MVGNSTLFAAVELLGRVLHSRNSSRALLLREGESENLFGAQNIWSRGREGRTKPHQTIVRCQAEVAVPKIHRHSSCVFWSEGLFSVVPSQLTLMCSDSHLSFPDSFPLLLLL